EQVPELAGLNAVQRESVQSALRDALDGARRMRAIVNDLKMLSAPRDQGAMRVDVIQVLESSINLAASQLNQRARLVRDFHFVPEVMGSPYRLGQVCLNLLLNAAQAIRGGSPATDTIQVRTRLERGRVVIEIIDSGEGIPEENMGRLFDPFFTTKPVG